MNKLIYNKWGFAFIYALCLTSFYCCNNKTKNEETISDSDETRIALTKNQYQAAGIETGRIATVEFANEIKSNGIIDVPPQNLAIISAPMGGYVIKTHVLPGMHVHKGEALAELRHQDYIQLQQDFLMALNKLAYAEKEYERQREMSLKNVNAAKDLQAADADYENLKTTVNALQEKIEMLGLKIENLKKGKIVSVIFIRSPINGNIKSVNVSLGKYVNPMDIMYEVVDNSHSHIELRVFEKDILNVEEGQKIRFTVPTTGSRTFTGRVYLVGKTIDVDTRTVIVHGHLDKEEKKALLPGMYVDATIIGNTFTTLAIPEDATVKQNENYFVFEQINADNEKMYFNKRKIQPEDNKNGFYLLGLKDNGLKDKNIVLKGAYYINAQMNKTEE